jgi:hypothetical protein
VSPLAHREWRGRLDGLTICWRPIRPKQGPSRNRACRRWAERMLAPGGARAAIPLASKVWADLALMDDWAGSEHRADAVPP